MDRTAGGKAKAAKNGLSSWFSAVDWSLIAFVLALCCGAFAYGVVTMKMKIFPYQLFVNAKLAAASLRLMEDENVLNGMTRFDDKTNLASSVKMLDPAAGSELLLVTGGPNRDAFHCPKFGCLAWIINRRGEILHSWPLDLEGLFTDAGGFVRPTELQNFYPVGLELQTDGSLIATFHCRNFYPYAVGIARIGRKGEIIWKHLDNAHHWFTTTEDGLILSPVQLRPKVKFFPGTSIEARCPTPIYDEGVRVYRADGSVVKTLSALSSLSESGYPGLLYGLRNDCDPIHINSVEAVTPAIASKLPGASAGDFLVSLREPSVVAVIDQVDGHIKKLVSGRTAAQHSAHFLPDGSVVAFDNLGGSQATGGSRIARIDLSTGKTDTLFPRDGSEALLPFYASDGGHISVSPDSKRLMISTKDDSRDIEIEIATGKPLWSMTHIHDVAPFMPGGNDKSKVVTALFKSWGTYYVTAEQARGLGLASPPR